MKSKKVEPELEDRRELAARKNVSVRTVAEMMKRGLPFLKLSPRMVRFITSDVDRWFAKHRVGGAR